ncbi:MAG: hypothetical protein J4F28_08295 [Nitrosopumilaceae archaeon]|nr:hypothetical protein [Nitrosopumilaceae archaeon]
MKTGRKQGTILVGCTHDVKYEVEAPQVGGGLGVERVCGVCGIVKDDVGAGGGVGAPTPMSTPQMGGLGVGGGATAGAGSRPNLYLEMEVGGKPDRTLRGDRYVHRQADLAAVSNIAQKLGVPNNVSMTVWQWYRRLRKKLKMTKAKCLVLAFFAVCRRMGCPILENRLDECIRMELGVRHAHAYLRVVMEASRRMEDGEMVLRKCGWDGGGGGGRRDVWWGGAGPYRYWWRGRRWGRRCPEIRPRHGGAVAGRTVRGRNHQQDNGGGQAPAPQVVSQ